MYVHILCIHIHTYLLTHLNTHSRTYFITDLLTYSYLLACLLAFVLVRSLLVNALYTDHHTCMQACMHSYKHTVHIHIVYAVLICIDRHVSPCLCGLFLLVCQMSVLGTRIYMLADAYLPIQVPQNQVSPLTPKTEEQSKTEATNPRPVSFNLATSNPTPDDHQVRRAQRGGSKELAAAARKAQGHQGGRVLGLLPNFVIGVRGKISCFVVQTLQGRDFE